MIRGDWGWLGQFLVGTVPSVPNEAPYGALIMFSEST